MKRDPLSVFVNVTFDEPYEHLFRALMFTNAACGHQVRCALEDDDSANIRMDKLERLIGESPRVWCLVIEENATLFWNSAWHSGIQNSLN